MDESRRQKINKETLAINEILDQMDLSGLNIPPQNRRIHILYENGIFSRTDYILGHKTSLKIFKKT